jgi:hypothetical protein
VGFWTLSIVRYSRNYKTKNPSDFQLILSSVFSDFLLGLFLDPEGGGDMLFRNVDLSQLHSLATQKISFFIGAAVTT